MYMNNPYLKTKINVNHDIRFKPYKCDWDLASLKYVNTHVRAYFNLAFGSNFVSYYSVYNRVYCLS